MLTAYGCGSQILKLSSNPDCFPYLEAFVVQKGTMTSHVQEKVFRSVSVQGTQVPIFKMISYVTSTSRRLAKALEISWKVLGVS